MTSEISSPTEEPSIDLLPSQDLELAHLLDDAALREAGLPYSGVTWPLTYMCGGPGSGKTATDFLQIFLRSERCVDQPYGLFANTEAQLQTFIGVITEHLDAIGMQHVFETKAPPEWRRRWRRDGIRIPPRRLRNLKMWIWEDGTHVFCATLVNGAYTRAKSLNLMAALIEEATEPGVTREAIIVILRAVRCGVAKADADGGSECKRRGHLHETVVKFNVPLLDPSHWSYKENERLLAQEAERKEKGLPPFYRIIEVDSRENFHTGRDYIDRLRASMDADTFEQQISGKLKRNISATSYHQFSERNVLDSLTYDNRRPLHIYFDFNNWPAVSGWGVDLRWDEVPEIERRAGREYFGIIGELFSGSDPMQTDQVAYALLEDPTRNLDRMDARCIDCGCKMREHMELDAESGWLCQYCSWRADADVRAATGSTKFCSGRTASIDERSIPGVSRLIHATPNWRGLVNHRADIYVYGDATGKASHADAPQRGGSRKVLRMIFEEALGDRVHFRFKEANPPVIHRVLAVNKMLCDGQRVRSLFLGSWCTAHRDDFREVVPDLKTGEPKKVAKSLANLAKSDYCLRTDISDALGYMIDVRWPYERVDSRALPSLSGPGSLGPMDTRWPAPR